MQLRHLRYFVKIVDAGSFSRAAANIHVAQPALSQQIAELEAELGVRLLHRSARGVRPTAAGEALYREGLVILQQMEQLPTKVRITSGEVEGTVALGMSSTLAAVLAGPVMEACRDIAPKVSLRLITDHSLRIKSRLEERSLDLGAVFEDHETPGFSRLLMFRQRLYLIQRDRPKDGQASAALAELASRSLVLATVPNVTRALIDRVFLQAGIVSNVVAEANILSGLLSAVASDIGNTILPKGDFSDMPGYSGLSAIAIDPPFYLTAAMLSSGDFPLTRAGEKVRDIVVALVAKRLLETLPPGAEWIGEKPAISGADSGILK